MSGHSKWSTIKRKKGALDAKRSKMFARVSKEIQIAIKEGGSNDPEMNPRLRMAVANAKGVNMPKDNIERLLKKGDKDSTSYEEVTFEGYLPNGVAVFVECLTDNNNRTVSDVRSVFNKRGGNLGTNGSLSFLFERKGVFMVPKKDINAEDFQLEIIDAGLEDIEEENDYFILTTSLEDFGNMQKKLEELKVEVENAELKRIPNDYAQLSVEDGLKILKIIDDFEDLDDVQNVYHNLDVTDEMMAKMDEE